MFSHHKNQRAQLISLSRVHPEKGRCVRADLPGWLGRGDHEASPMRSSLRLFEDGNELGYAHALHDEIRELGGGRFSHWEESLFFSSSDGSVPGSNGRIYQALIEPLRVSSVLSGVLQSLPDLENASAARKHEVLRRVAALINPHLVLPDMGSSLEQDDAFQRTFARFFAHTRNTLDRKYMVWQLAQHIAHLPGDVAEVGCYTGATAWFLADRIREYGGRKSLYLFDSFAGLSQPSSLDKEYWRAGDLSCDEETVRENLAEFPFVTLHKGWVPERFDDVNDCQFSFVHIDVDLYQPTLLSAAFFYDRLVSGGILICDDYGFATCPGATAALDEVMAERPEPIIRLPSGGAMVIKH